MFARTKSLKVFLIFSFLLLFFAKDVYAGNISSSNFKAKILEDNSIINTGYFTNVSNYDVTVGNSSLTGMFFSENYGWIRLSCESIGSLSDTCTNYNYKVTNDGNGNLAGFAWGENTGWISFSCSNSTSSCGGGAGNWGVSINTTSGNFSGYAWGENVGWIEFNCSSSDSCTNTSWRPAGSGGGGGGGGGGSGSGSGSGGSDSGGGDSGGGDSGGSDSGGGDSGGGDSGGSDSGGGDSGGGDSGGGDSGGGESGGSDSGGGDSGGGDSGGGDSGGGESGGSDSGGGDSGSESSGVSTGISGVLGSIGSSVGSFVNSIFGNLSLQVDPDCTTAYCGTLRAVGGVTKNVAVTAQKTKKVIQEVEKIEAVQEVGAVAATTGAVVGSVSLFSTLLFVNPLSLGEIIFIPIRIWSFLMILFGIKKKSQPWGTVYDSITKQPLDPAYVSLLDKDGKEIDSAITDLDGRFGFLIGPGEYTIVANKTNYTFPSKYLEDKTEDEVYKDLYFGNKIVVTQEQFDNQSELVIYNIPMDSQKFDWNEFEKDRTNVMRFYKKTNKWLVKFADIMFYVGFLVSALAYWVNTKEYNLIMVMVYVLMFILRNTFLRPKPRAKISYENKKPASFSVVHIKRNGKDFIKKVADQNGQIFCLLPNGEYTIDIERKNLDGTYVKVLEDHSINIKKGIFAEKFVIEEEVQKFADILYPIKR